MVRCLIKAQSRKETVHLTTELLSKLKFKSKTNLKLDPFQITTLCWARQLTWTCAKCWVFSTSTRRVMFQQIRQTGRASSTKARSEKSTKCWTSVPSNKARTSSNWNGLPKTSPSSILGRPSKSWSIKDFNLESLKCLKTWRSLKTSWSLFRHRKKLWFSLQCLVLSLNKQRRNT